MDHRFFIALLMDRKNNLISVKKVLGWILRDPCTSGTWSCAVQAVPVVPGPPGPPLLCDRGRGSYQGLLHVNCSHAISWTSQLDNLLIFFYKPINVYK